MLWIRWKYAAYVDLVFFVEETIIIILWYVYKTIYGSTRVPHLYLCQRNGHRFGADVHNIIFVLRLYLRNDQDCFHTRWYGKILHLSMSDDNYCHCCYCDSREDVTLRYFKMYVDINEDRVCSLLHTGKCKISRSPNASEK